MTRIEFYYDPSCPFCWITSRWLLRVQPHRDLDVTWRPFSLAMKNDELADDGSDRSPHGEGHRAAHRVLRVIEAARREGGSVIDLYSAFGRRAHVDHVAYDDAVIAAVLAEEGMPPVIASAADDTSLDDHLEAELTSALDVVGTDVGVPVIVFVDGQDRRGFFGPVLNTMPDEAESLALWDGLATMAGGSAFYELKRSRPSGGPDTASTAGL